MVNEKLHYIGVTEVDTIAELISDCNDQFQHCFANNAIQVLKSEVDLATLNQTTTLADIDIDETTVLNIEAHSDSNSSSSLHLFIKTVTGKTYSITNAQSNW
jgi:hypothetical protein